MGKSRKPLPLHSGGHLPEESGRNAGKCGRDARRRPAQPDYGRLHRRAEAANAVSGHLRRVFDDGGNAVHRRNALRRRVCAARAVLCQQPLLFGSITRLNKIEGQVRGIKNMVENDRYCVDILTQVSAVQSALNSFNKILLSQHIKTCVVDDIKSGNDEVVDELLNTIQKIVK